MSAWVYYVAVYIGIGVAFLVQQLSILPRGYTKQFPLPLHIFNSMTFVLFWPFFLGMEIFVMRPRRRKMQKFAEQFHRDFQREVVDALKVRAATGDVNAKRMLEIMNGKPVEATEDYPLEPTGDTRVLH